MYGEQDRRILVFDESLEISVHLHYDAPVVEHLKCPYNSAPFQNVVSDWQPGFCSNGTRGNH
jgi:hypothetical protein